MRMCQVSLMKNITLTESTVMMYKTDPVHFFEMDTDVLDNFITVVGHTVFDSKVCSFCEKKS